MGGGGEGGSVQLCGRLGILNLQTKNLALLTKWVGRLMSLESETVTTGRGAWLR